MNNRKLAGRRAFFAASLAFVISQANLAVMLAPLHPSVFALQLAFTAEDFWRVVAAWGGTGLATYRAHFFFDNLHPFTYGAFGYLAVWHSGLFTGDGPGRRRLLAQMLPLAGVFDLAENVAHLYLLDQPAGSGGILVPLSALCSLGKWSLAALFAMLIGWRVGGGLWQWLRGDTGRQARETAKTVARYAPPRARVADLVGKRHSVAEIEGFILLLRSAVDDPAMKAALGRLLAMPDAARQSFVERWVGDLLIQQAPMNLVEAIACLFDDKVAAKTREVLLSPLP